MNADVLTTRVDGGIAVITLGSAKQIYFNAEMGDMLTAALEEFAGDANVRVVVVTGGAPGYFNRHFSIPALLELAEAVRASGRQWADNATYHGGFFDRAMALCETMPKPVIAAISGTALAGAFEFALACDLRIAEDGDYLIGFPETELGLVPGAGGTQRLPRVVGMPVALMHILMGKPINPREAERKGFVARDSCREGSRPGNGGRAPPGDASAGSGRLRQTPRSECHRDAFSRWAGARTQSLL